MTISKTILISGLEVFLPSIQKRWIIFCRYVTALSICSIVYGWSVSTVCKSDMRLGKKLFTVIRSKTSFVTQLTINCTQVFATQLTFNNTFRY